MEDKRTNLAKNKIIAGAMMVGAALLFVLAHYKQRQGVWAWIAAFAEAAMVGALADWFAVVALFRHPLGIPIPHTAIIRNKKNVIAESLAEFMREKFLATDAIVAKLRELNPAEKLSSFLTTRENVASLARGLGRIATESLDFIDDERVQKLLRDGIQTQLMKLDLSSYIGLVLDTLVKDNRHQRFLDEALRRIAAWLEMPDSRARIATILDNWFDSEYPKLSKIIPNREVLARGAGEKVVNVINGYIQEINGDPAHELRDAFNETINDFIVRLRDDAGLQARIEELKRSIITNPHISGYIENLWCDLKIWLHQDLTRPDSTIHRRIESAAAGLGQTLAESRDLRDSINEHLEMMVRRYGDDLRKGIARYISGTVKQWNDDDFVDEIELSIGSDLQFIRMNGTLVGGVIGLVIHALSLLFP